MEVIEVTEREVEIIEVIERGPQGPQGAGITTLTTKGDLLYRGDTTGERLPIGTSGQILKVAASGIPEWGAAPSSGVSSVSGTSPIVSSGGATPAISITAATTSAAGSMSAADKTKLDGIASGAEVNVNADWNASSGDAQILNKPTIPTASSSTPSALGTAAVGTSSNYARADHVHAMPSASDVGAAADNDPRLSDTRDPNAHAASHYLDGGDDVIIENLATDQTNAGWILTASGSQGNAAGSKYSLAFARAARAAAVLYQSNDINAENAVMGCDTTGTWTVASPENFRTAIELGAAATADIGTGSTEVAAGDHGHGNLTSDGKVGSTAGLPVVTTTAGAVTTLALGTANQVLRVNSGATGVEFADPAASGVTGAASSASDVLGVSGANITGVDANADRIVYWNNTSNKLAYGTPADAGAAAASHTHAASDITSGTIDTARLASGTANSGTFLRGDQTWATAGGVTTGSVDNAILRADGVGGSTSQSSDISILDATTSTQNNVQISNEHSGQTNSALVLTPKGTGAFILGPRPTGAVTTGNARGANAVDLQTNRGSATQVASGGSSAVLGGRNNVASGLASVAAGTGCQATNESSVALGNINVASGTHSLCAGGDTNTASGAWAICFGSGISTASGVASFVLGGDYTLADRSYVVANSSGRFAANGDAQWIHVVLRAKTTTNSAVELQAGGFSASSAALNIPSGKVISGIVNIHGVRSDGSAVAHYIRQFSVKNVAGTSSENYAAVTIGTDLASGTSITFNNPDTNSDRLSISVTGVASQTWRWTAHVSAVETAYGT